VSAHALLFVLLFFKNIEYNLAFWIHHQKKNLKTFGVNIELLDREEVLEDFIHQFCVEINVRKTARQLKLLKALEEL
jgi:hypothetical protein